MGERGGKGKEGREGGKRENEVVSSRGGCRAGMEVSEKEGETDLYIVCGSVLSLAFSSDLGGLVVGLSLLC